MNQSKTAIPFYQLESKRLIIRPWKETDFSAFKATNSDPLVMEHFPEILSEDESRTLFDEINRRIDQNGFGFWACEVKATGDVIDLLGLMNQQRSEEHTSELQSRFDIVCRLLLE